MGAGHPFAAEPGGGWVWDQDDLRDSRGEVIATVRTNVLQFGEERLLIELERAPMRLRMRATAGDGAVYLLGQQGFTVRQLTAVCDGRPYSLVRDHPLGKQRTITHHGVPIAVVRPALGGKVEITDLPGMDGVPWLDAVFLSWGCAVVDGVGRREQLRLSSSAGNRPRR